MSLKGIITISSILGAFGILLLCFIAGGTKKEPKGK